MFIYLSEQIKALLTQVTHTEKYIVRSIVWFVVLIANTVDC